MQHGKVIEGGFRSTTLSEQAEAPVKRCLDYSLLLKYVGEGPVAHAVHQSVALTNGVGQPRSHERAVGHLRLIAVVGVELAPDQRDFGIGGSGDLAAHFLNRAV